MPNWTPAQQNAIDARGKNILVSAAAGSGKTAVLVERVVKLITDEINPVDIDKLLNVTFTNAAAAEMKSRISVALNELIKEYPNNTNAIKQLSLLPSATICTIDSFCMNLLRENFFKLDIAQDFKVLDDSEALLIKQSAADSVIEQLYDENKTEFKSLVEMFSSSMNDSNFSNTIQNIHSYIMSQPFPLIWLRKVVEYYNPAVSIDDSIFKDYIIKDIKASVSYVMDIIKSSYNCISPDDEIKDVLVSLLDSDYNVFDSIDNALSNSWDDLKNAIDNASFVTMTRKQSPAKEDITNNRNIYKKILSDDIAPLVTATSREFTEDNEILYPILNLLCDVVEMYNDKMLEIKREMNAYSFADIEHFAIDLLFSLEDDKIVRTELAEDYAKNFSEILVDEYQDTNTAQDTLFAMLSNGKNEFMVGDVKQSIYRFRLAMPQLFTDKKNSFTYYDENDDSLNQKIILDKNFRSRKGVCDYCNYIFSNIMSEQIGELSYNEEEFLNPNDDYEDKGICSAQIKLVCTPNGVDKDEYEAHQVAKMILKMIESKQPVKDDKTYRPISFGDIAILFRSTKNVMPIYSKVLTEYGIPVASSNKINLFENNEVAILMSLLRVIDNPTLDIPLLATLMSVFYGYTPDDISYAKVTYPAGSLYASISADKDRFSRFLDDLDRYRKYSASMSVELFIRQIIQETSFMSIVSAMGNSEQRRLNVFKLIDIARMFDNGDSVGLTAFIRYVDNIVSSKLSIESAEITHTGEDSVVLMSVHKSKGLEFPVVILANSAHKYNVQELSSQIQLNDSFGVGLKVHNEQGMYRYNSIQYSAIKNMNHTALMSENLRVLYVAVTRAKEQFISIISNSNFDNHIDALSKKIINNTISPLVVKHIQNDGDLFLLTALMHKDGNKLCNSIVPKEFSFDMDIQYLDDLAENNEDVVSKVEANDELVSKIKDKLSFTYDRLELSGYLSKRTASSLDEKENEFTYFASSKPAFLNDSGFTPAQRGTAMHTFMQFCDYENSRDNLDDEIESLVKKNHITKEQAECLDREKLVKLFNSSFANRLFSSSNIYREIKVSSFVPVSQYEDTSFDDNILIQGIADCVFEENGELILVDYKTDRVCDEQELLDRYKNQIAFYKSAISKTLQKPVKEAMLYSFYLDKCCIYK